MALWDGGARWSIARGVRGEQSHVGVALGRTASHPGFSSGWTRYLLFSLPAYGLRMQLAAHDCDVRCICSAAHAACCQCLGAAC